MNTIKPLEFNIKFITPLIIGGADNVDENGLSGKALRGCWRFWFRAIVGGIMKDITKKDLISLENQIFGSADNDIGAKFRLNVIKLDKYEPKKFSLGFTKYNERERCQKEVKKYGFPQGSSYLIKIIPRQTMSEIQKNILLTAIWLWGNLGAVGNRERRGFGSPNIYINKIERSPFEFNSYGNKIELLIRDKDQPFADLKEIEDHIRNGLTIIWDVYEKWIKDNNIETIQEKLETLSAPTDALYFILRSRKQILVGDISYSKLDDAIIAVHGSSTCNELGWANHDSRMASPVFIRFYSIGKKNDEEYLPIFTWCKQRNVQDNNCAWKYLISIFNRNINKNIFTLTLAGNPI